MVVGFGSSLGGSTPVTKRPPPAPAASTAVPAECPPQPASAPSDGTAAGARARVTWCAPPLARAPRPGRALAGHWSPCPHRPTGAKARTRAPSPTAAARRPLPRRYAPQRGTRTGRRRTLVGGLAQQRLDDRTQRAESLGQEGFLVRHRVQRRGPGRPAEGGLPAAGRGEGAPSDHRSEAGPTSDPITRSGAMNSREPTSSPVVVRDSPSSRAAMPKSVRTALPSRRSSTLAGLMSRCRVPAACTASSASSSCRPRTAVCCGVSGPVSAIRWASEGPPRVP